MDRERPKRKVEGDRTCTQAGSCDLSSTICRAKAAGMHKREPARSLSREERHPASPLKGLGASAEVYAPGVVGRACDSYGKDLPGARCAVRLGQ